MVVSGSSASKRAGINDVAQLAGVSRQTVTRAMNDMADISPATKQRVLDAARELRYRPSRYGRGLVKQGAPTLGLVVDDLTNMFYAQLASSVLEAASQRGWTVLVVEWAHGGDRALEELAMQVDAVVCHFAIEQARVDAVFGNLPVVLFDSSVEGELQSSIDIDFEPGMHAAVTHLIETGRHDVVMLDCTWSGARSERSLVFDRVAEDADIRSVVVQHATEREPGIESGRRAIEGLLAEHPDTDAIVAFSDSVAIGAIKELTSRGVRVPEQIAVVGIDGLPFGLVVTPELTTLALDLRAIGAMALDLLVDMASADAYTTRSVRRRTIAHTLVVRASS